MWQEQISINDSFNKNYKLNDSFSYERMSYFISGIGHTHIVCTDKKFMGEDIIFSKKITKEDSKIDWSESPWEIHNQVRAISGYIEHKGQRVKILHTFWDDTKKDFEIVQVQPEGKQPMGYDSFARGHGKIIREN